MWTFINTAIFFYSYTIKFLKENKPYPSGVIASQDTHGGGGQFDPTFKSHVWCPNMTKDISFESSYALLLEPAKKLANLQKLKCCFCKMHSYI